MFASTLVRLYPTTSPELAASIAHSRYATDKQVDPVMAAELYALEEGRPEPSRD